MIRIYHFLIIFLVLQCSSIEEKITQSAYNGDLESLKKLLGTNVNVQDNRGWTPLMSAAENGQFEVVKYLLENKAQTNLRNEKGDTALIRASVTGQTEIVKLLIEAGASVHLKNKKGYTPLMKAAERNHLDVMRVLLDKGAKPNEVKIPEKDHDTALHLAVKENATEAVTLLIQKGANVNSKNSDGFTPIMLAIEKENISMIQKLLEAKADLNQVSYYGDTIFTLIENKPENIKKLFYEKSTKK